MDDRQEVCGRLLKARGDRPESFEPVEEAFDLDAQPIQLRVLTATVVLAAGVHRDDRLHLSRSDRVHDAVRVVACIRDEGLSSRVLDQMLRFRRVVPLACGEGDLDWLAARRRDSVDFRRKASSRTAQTIASDPPFPPAASWCARTTVASMSEPTSSTSALIWSSLKIRSQTPRAAHRAKRLYTVFQGPYLGGMSRHGAPVFTRHNTALMKFRSPSLPGGPGRVGIWGSTNGHCTSVSSCRCTASVDQLFDRSATMISTTSPEPNFRPRRTGADLKIRDTP